MNRECTEGTNRESVQTLQYRLYYREHAFKEYRENRRKEEEALTDKARDALVGASKMFDA